MIKINKSLPPPDILKAKGKTKSKGEVKTEKNIAKFNANPDAFKKKFHKTKNPNKFDFSNRVYAATDVKQQLIKDQHGKCCFCETADIKVIAHGDVEHFRPKKAYKQKSADSYSYPGYYWKAFSWDNLFFSCQICNQIHKKNMFPLIDETLRQFDHTCAEESLDNTLLVDPSLENPETEIGFKKEMPYPITLKGEKSIQVFGLKRNILNEARLKHLEDVSKNLVLNRVKLKNFTPSEIQEIKRDLCIKTI